MKAPQAASRTKHSKGVFLFGRLPATATSNMPRNVRFVLAFLDIQMPVTSRSVLSSYASSSVCNDDKNNVTPRALCWQQAPCSGRTQEMTRQTTFAMFGTISPSLLIHCLIYLVVSLPQMIDHNQHGLLLMTDSPLGGHGNMVTVHSSIEAK